MKKLLSIIIAILMIVTAGPMAFAADVVKSGNCGANGGNVKWTLDSDGTLTISGTGDMATYATLTDRPWYGYTSDIKKIIIEDGVTSIADYTAYGCFYATSISIGKDVKSIGPSYTTFYCRDLETITVSEDNEYYKAVDNVLFSKDGKELLKVACKALSGTYNVPDGVVKIDKKAFDICKNIEKVVLPDSVEEIGEYAFYECFSLETLDIGMAKISSVGNGVFEWIEHPVEVIADKDNEYVSAANGSLFSKIDGTLYHAYITGNEYFIPYGVKILTNYTIDTYDTECNSIVIPDTVERIESDAIMAWNTVVHYFGSESQWQEIYDDTWGSIESMGAIMHYCDPQNISSATCTNDGVAEWYCSTCDETIKYVTGYAFGHDIVEVEAKAPTCTQVGNEAYEYCTACDYTTYVEIPALTHTDANCDYKCDYNCGYVYETLDFSDAKVLTTVDGVLYIDGVEAETNSSKSQSRIYEGKYILGGDIETSRYIWILGDTTLDLNGYTWNLTKYINVNAPLSVYDTSEAETGKITSGSSNLTISINDVAAGFNLYGGTIENTSSSGRCVLDVSWADVNLYAGKIKSNSQAIYFVLGDEITINIDDTVIESGDDYADVLVALGINDIAKGDIDVTDYKGDSLTAKVNVTSTLGKIKVFKGIKNTQDAEKYQIIDVVCNESFDLFWKKTEYDEVTGEKSIYTSKNAFTQQPSADNNFTVDFNNPAATFQWYEVEEEKLGTYIVEEHGPLFSHDFKAGDILKVSTDSELRHVVIETGIIDTDYEFIDLDEYEKTATITFDADTTVDFFVAIVNADNPVEVNFTVLTGTKLDGETEKTLQNAECGKSYCCKATVGENVYVSDSVVGHSLVSVDAQAPTCTEIGWEAYEYCTACDYSTYVEIPVDTDAHTPLEAVKENEVAPKCGVAGSYDLVVYCDDCGAELDRETKTVDALTHTFTKYEVIEEAKCGVAGKEVATCDNGCGETDKKAIDALTHKDADGDYKCDNGCGHEFEKPAPEDPTPDTPDEPEDEVCDHLCHKGGFMGFIWKIIKFFSKLFKINPVCECGAAHY